MSDNLAAPTFGCWLRPRCSSFVVVTAVVLQLIAVAVVACQNGDLQGPRVGAEEFLSGARDRPVHH